MKVVRKGRLKAPKNVGVNSTAQVLRSGRIRNSIGADCYFAAEKISKEAARIARNQIGASDRVVRGYVVQPSSSGYWDVLNISRGNKGRALGQPWEQGTGIYYRKYENAAGGSKGPIEASRYGKPYFAWLQRANEQKAGVVFFGAANSRDEGVTASIGQGRVRRDGKGRIRKRRTRPGEWIFAKKIDGYPGTHALEKASVRLSKMYRWRYDRNRRK